MDWICCQIGAREHYVIPRILQEKKLLKRFYTDIWLKQDRFIPGIINQYIPRLAGRYDHLLPESRVVSFTSSALLFELFRSLSMKDSWIRISERNQWFQHKVIASKKFQLDCKSENKSVVFGYSYAALDIFRKAKEQDCITILDQIDAGTVEEDIVADALRSCSHLRPTWSRAPKQYWQPWKQECDLADRIIVNSSWSKEALVQAGVNEIKIAVVPLMYERKGADSLVKNYPDTFTRSTPLKVLFLGSLVVRKGIAEMLQAVQEMQHKPIEFWFVGNKGVSLTDEMKQNKNIYWIGPVPRSEVEKYYRMCDVFILPTLSDGFGLTQLEAMSYGLPVIASRNCGEVVEDGINGILLPEVTGDAITHVLKSCLDNPEILKQWSGNALQRVKDFSPEKIFPEFISVVDDYDN